MKYWIWICLELLIMLCTGVLIYFFPEDALAKVALGCGLFWLVEECKEINRRNKMKKIKGYNIVKEKTNELLVSIEIGNDEVIEKDGYKVIPFYEEENPTIKQNARENQIEGGVASISGTVAKQYRPFKDCDELVECWERKIFIPAMQYTKQKVLFKPEIWVKSKAYGTDNLITAFDGDNESIGGSCVFIQDQWFTLQDLYEHFVFLDGSCIGVTL